MAFYVDRSGEARRGPDKLGRLSAGPLTARAAGVEISIGEEIDAKALWATHFFVSMLFFEAQDQAMISARGLPDV